MQAKIPSFKFALKTTLGKRILPSPMSFLLIRTVVGQVLFDASFVFRCMMLIVGTPSIVFISPYYILSFPIVSLAWDNWWIFSKPLFRKWWFRKWKWWICQNRSHIPFRAVWILYFICNLIFPLHLFSSYVSFCHNRIVLLQQNWQ